MAASVRPASRRMASDCSPWVGAAPATAPAGAAAATEEEQAQAQNGALVRGPWRPPPLGLGDSYEGAMFGDYGYGGFGGYSPYGYSYGRGGLGWGGYGRDSAWEVAYGGGPRSANPNPNPNPNPHPRLGLGGSLRRR